MCVCVSVCVAHMLGVETSSEDAAYAQILSDLSYAKSGHAETRNDANSANNMHNSYTDRVNH